MAADDGTAPMLPELPVLPAGAGDRDASTATAATAITRPSRVAWASAGAAFIAGIVASLAANVAHAQASAGARTVAGWAPLALLLTIEVVLRVPPPRQWWLAALRHLSTVMVAAVAAIASFRHMKGLALSYGEDGLTAATLPLSADGLIFVASLALLTLAEQRRTAIAGTAAPAATTAEPAPAAAPAPAPAPAPAAAAAAAAAAAEPAGASVEPAAAPASAAPAAAAAPVLAGALPPEAIDMDPVRASVPGTIPRERTPDADLSLAGVAAAASMAAVPALPVPGWRTPARSFPAADQEETPELHARAYQLFEQSVADGRPMSGARLGLECGRSERWGRERIAEAKTRLASGTGKRDLAAHGATEQLSAAISSAA